MAPKYFNSIKIARKSIIIAPSMNISDPDKIIESVIKSRSDRSIRIETLIQDKQILDILNDVDNILVKEPILLKIPPPVRVVGDLHGNIDDLLRIFETDGYPPNMKYLFLGEYVDRGICSFEVMITLFALKIKFPQHIYLIRGNHEIQHISESYGFLEELKYKYSAMIFYAFHSVFVNLPLLALVGKKILCVHGGIGPKLGKISRITKLTKPDDIKDGIFADIVWSDPRDQKEKFTPNTRGIGYYFNQDALHEFLQLNNLDLLIRSHELCNGCQFPYAKSDECITVFSNTDYCNRKNDAAIIAVDGLQVTKKTIKYLTNEEKKKWKPVYPEWLIQTNNKADINEEYDEPSSEIDLLRHDSKLPLSHSVVHIVVD